MPQIRVPNVLHATSGVYDQNGLRLGPPPRMRYAHACPFRPYVLPEDESTDVTMSTEDESSTGMNVDVTLIDMKTEPSSNTTRDSEESTTDDSRNDESWTEPEDYTDSDESTEKEDGPAPKRIKRKK